MNALRSGYRVFCRIEQAFVGVLIVGITGLVFVSAIARGVGYPLNWATDLALLAFAWLVFIGADVALKQSDFMRVDLLVKRFPLAVQKALYYTFAIMAIGLLAIIIVQGVPLAIDNAKRLFQTLGISYAWATVSAPVGSFLMIVTISIRLVQYWGKNEIVVDAKEAI